MLVKMETGGSGGGSGKLDGYYNASYSFAAGASQVLEFSQFKTITSVFVRRTGYIAFGLLSGDDLSTFNHFTNYATELDVLNISENTITIKNTGAGTGIIGISSVLA